MTEEKRKYCPFTLGNVVPSWCCEEDCMAWMPEKMVRRAEWGDTDKSEPRMVTLPGFCRLITFK